MRSVENWRRSSVSLVVLILCWMIVESAQSLAGPYDAPANYYNSATGTGSTLKSQLRSIMTNGHIQRSYGDFRYSAAVTDADPDVPGNILLVYNRASVSGVWNAGGSLPWNREHVWPQSLQPGSASNGTRGNLGDPHALRPADTQINSNRGHRAFGFEDTTGSHRTIGSDYYYPGDADRGDIARQLFYSATRYTGLSLVEGVPGSNSMGDLSSLIAWHYLDVPDTFETRRNHAIYSSSLNPSYYTNNRNAFIDHPEFVWSVFVDQQNDSQIAIEGTTPAADGSSSMQLELGRVLVGASTPATQQVISLNKSGNDGTYYQVTASGSATSTQTEGYHAFRTGGTDSTSLTVGLENVDTGVAGQRSGTVTIDNLDVTTSGGAGRGANDGDDVIDITLDVLDHANPSFDSESDLQEIAFDFGTVQLGSAAPTWDFSLFNRDAFSGFTAGLDLDAITPFGDSSALTTDLSLFSGGSTLEAGSELEFSASLDTSIAGDFLASYTLQFSDEDLPGADTLDTLIVALKGRVEEVAVENADFDADSDIDGQDFLTWQRGVPTGVGLAEGDANADMIVDELDLAIWNQQYATSPQASSLATVPEPSTAALAIMLVALWQGRTTARV